jgi:hypothetical protein
VEYEEWSEALCPQRVGSAKWKCLDNGLFDDNGPDWTQCYKWLDDLPNNITDLDNAFEIIDIISNNTMNNNTIVNSEKLLLIMDRIANLQLLVDNGNGVDLVKARIYTSKTITILSNLINQTYAWNNATQDEKIEIASKILLYTQYSSFTLVCQQNNTHKVEEIETKNILLNTFVSNYSEELNFLTDTKHSSITVPSGIHLNDSDKRCSNTAVGAVIDEIQDYLSFDKFKINSEILSFSLTNKTQTIQLNKEVTIK